MPRSKLVHKQRLLLAGGIAALALAGIIIVVILTHHSPSKTISPITPGSSSTPSTTSSPSSTGSTAKGAGSTPTTPSKQSSPTTTAASGDLTAPQGQASHTVVSKSAGDQADNSPNLDVVCLTSSANSCVVRLTSPKDKITTIQATQNDHQGSFIFYWNVKDYEIGTWKMELVASRNGQEAATNIGPLEVTL